MASQASGRRHRAPGCGWKAVQPQAQADCRELLPAEQATPAAREATPIHPLDVTSRAPDEAARQAQHANNQRKQVQSTKRKDRQGCQPCESGAIQKGWSTAHASGGETYHG